MTSNLIPELLSAIRINNLEFAVIKWRDGVWRLGAMNPDWRDKLPQAVEAGKTADLPCGDGFWLSQAAGAARPLISMCCGLGSVWPGMGQELYQNFPIAAAAMDEVARLADWDILALMDERNLDKISQTRWQIPYLFMLEYAQWKLLQAFGARPAAFCGHSLGELIALCFAGVYPLAAAWHLLDTRAEHMAELESKDCRKGGMLAVPADYAEIAQILEQWPDLRVSNRNTEKQYILSGEREQLLAARKQLRRRRVPAIMLNMDLAFHNPAMRILRNMSLRRLNGLQMAESASPVLSCVDAKPYPVKKKDICRRIADLDENAVDWVTLIREIGQLYPHCVFMEFGPQETLCGITGEIFPDAPCLPVDKKGREAEAMGAALCQMFALGYLPLQRLGDMAARAVDIQCSAFSGYEPAAKNTEAAGDPLLEISDEDKATVFALIAEAAHLPVEAIRPDMDLRQDLAVRSSHFPFLMLEAERRLGHPVLLENLFRIITVADLARFLTGAATPDNAAEAVERGPRKLFLEQRRPLQRYAITETGQFRPAHLDPASGDSETANKPGIKAVINDAGLLSYLTASLASSGRIVEIGTGRADGSQIYLHVFAPQDSHNDAGCDLASFQAMAASGRQLIFLRRFVTDGGKNWQDEVLRWRAALEQTCSSDNWRAIALVESAIPTHNRNEAADWLALEIMYGQDRFPVWNRLAEVGSGPLFCPASDIFGPVYPDPEMPQLPDGSVFHGIVQYSCFADPDLATHGAGALFSPLRQFQPPEACGGAAWLPIGHVLATMRQAAKIAAPWLLPIGLADLRVFRLPALPPGVTRECCLAVNARLAIRLEGVEARIARIGLRLADIEDNGRKNGLWQPMADGRCILGEKAAPIPRLLDFAMPFQDTQDAYLRMFLDTLALGPSWRILDKFSQNDANDSFSALFMPPDSENGDCYKLLFTLLDAAFLGAMASIGVKSETPEELAQKLQEWRLAAIGFIRFDVCLLQAENLGNIRFLWHLSWQDANLTRFDVQAACGQTVLLTVQNLEFDRME